MQRVVLLLFAFVMFAHAEMTIKQDLSVSAESETTKYRSLVRVSGSEALLNLKTLTLADKNDIIKTYNAINAFLGKNSICKGGSFSIEPLYENKNGARMQVGFESQYSLECVFSEIQNSEFQRILRTIESEVGKNKYLSLGVSRIEKVLDEQALEILTEQLNARLLEFALQKAKEYSNLSHRKCNVKEINLGEESNAPFYAHTATLKSANDGAHLENVSLPTTKNPQKTVHGQVIFNCR